MNKITNAIKHALSMSTEDGKLKSQNNGMTTDTEHTKSDTDDGVKGYGQESSVDKQDIGYNATKDCIELQQTVYDLIKGIQDPEKPENLEELKVVNEEDVFVRQCGDDHYLIKIEVVPTVPHCSLAPLIGLCVRTKLERSLTEKYKLDIFLKKGSHSTADEINKQINDKERIAAAMENPNLRKLVDKCIEEEY